jgi:hypothetical protein
MSVEQRRALIEADHVQLSIARQCELVAISRSSFYYQPVGETVENLALMRLIDAQFLETPWYGSRQMAMHLRRDGHEVGRKRIRRLMATMGLMAIYQRPHTTVPHPAHRIYPYLLRGMVVDRPNRVWCADITYIPMRRGFLYLVAVMDWAKLPKVPTARPVEWQLRGPARCWPGGCPTRWTRRSALRRSLRLWHGSADRRSSTPTKVANSPPRSSPMS